MLGGGIVKQFDKQNISSRRRGVVAVLAAVCLVVLLICGSLAVDVGYICALTAEQQNNADAGALAGAVALQEDDSLSVLDRVRDVLARNQQAQGYLSLNDQIIEIGWWHPVYQTFVALDAVDWEVRGYAVRVRAYRNNAPLFLAAIMGKTSTNVSREAVTVGSGQCRGIWGVEGVRIPGNVLTDSYDSTKGDYDPDSPGDEGDVCSGRGIDGMGSIEIHGDMMTGMGYWPTLAGKAGIFSTGITTSSIDGMVGPYAAVPEGLVSQGDLLLKADEDLALDPGTYLFDSITLRARASITISGPTTIYVASYNDTQADISIAVDGDITATGKGFINTTEDPHNLTIVILGDDVTLNGTESFYGTVIAPNADVVLSGTSDYYGMVIGKTVLMRGDFEFHVDESLPEHDLMQPPPPALVR